MSFFLCLFLNPQSKIDFQINAMLDLSMYTLAMPHLQPKLREAPPPCYLGVPFTSKPVHKCCMGNCQFSQNTMNMQWQQQ